MTYPSKGFKDRFEKGWVRLFEPLSIISAFYELLVEAEFIGVENLGLPMASYVLAPCDVGFFSSLSQRLVFLEDRSEKRVGLGSARQEPVYSRGWALDNPTCFDP